MADNKAQLAPGFEEVPLNEGFEEVPLKPTMIQALGQKAANLGNSALQTGKDVAKAGVEDLADTGRGLVQGLTAGTSDELIGAAKASLPSSDEDQGQDWKTLYKKYQGIEQAKNDAAKARSPYLYGTGQVAGMVAPAVLTAGASIPEQAALEGGEVAAKLTAGQLAKKAAIGGLKNAGTGAVIGGVMGGTESEQGKLIGATPEEEQKLAADVVGGAATGALTGGAIGTALPLVKAGGSALKDKIGNKLSDYISNSPFWSQVGKSKELGEQGTNLYSENAIQGPIGETTGLIHQDTNATKDLVNRIYNVDTKLGQNVGQAIDNATDQGVTVDLTDPMLNSVNTFKNLINNDETLRANPKAQKLYDTIFQMSNDGEFDASNLTPKEVQSLRQDVVDFADSIKQKEPNIANLGYQFQGQIGDLLKQAVPEYKIAAERFEQFRRLVPETLISGAIPVDISQVNLGSMKNDEAKLFQSAKNMIQGSRMSGAGSNNAKETFKNLINGVDTFEKNEAERMASGQVPLNDDVPKLVDSSDKSQAEGLQDMIKNRADQSALLQQAWRTNPQESATTSIKGAMFGRGSIMNLANKYGLYKDTLAKPIAAPVNLVKKVYGSSEEELRGMAQKMSQVPGLQSVGKTLLQGLDNKDSAGVNAAIFSIMQNPQARILINGEDLDSEKENK